ncbi:MAG TPA: VOC family protein [Candidatus Dormibacteraeota bacterium]|nr:VOC family protein [Candidatus Dormibacteraeota bacterium]
MASGNVRFDHFLTYVEAPSIDRYLERYRSTGFLVSDRTERHDPGLRNGVVFFGSQYIEFCWVEDEALFSKGEPDEAVMRRAHRPFAIGLVSEDIQATHDDWLARGRDLPKVFSKAERGADNVPPSWSFQEIPEALLPGAWCFALTYHIRRPPERIAPNSTYAIAGTTFVSSSAEEHAAAWRDLLAPEASIDSSDEAYRVTIGPHIARWMEPRQYERRYGRSWEPALHRFGELAILHVLATDLQRVQSALVGSGREVIPVDPPSTDEPGLFLPPDAQDGFSFVVTEQPIGKVK